MSYELHLGNCIEVAKTLAENGFLAHSIVTDPPYGIEFMPKKWDKGIAFDPETWVMLGKLLPPGGHLIAFGGTRTYHRMACAIEDAGFEIRDSLMWLYGSGFPKSHNIALGIDKQNAGVKNRGVKIRMADSESSIVNGTEMPPYSAQTPEAKAWEGWGTALKPMFEPIILARKPLQGTIASNVLTHGVGGLNVDAGRIAVNEHTQIPLNTYTHKESALRPGTSGFVTSQKIGGSHVPTRHDLGRFPGNVLLDEEVAAEMDAKYGESVSRGHDIYQNPSHPDTRGAFRGIVTHTPQDSGGISRYFYIAKASRAERDAGVKRCFHPTVKPVELMRQLVRLVTPKGGICLDPFMGSGSTGIACQLEAIDFHGIEQSAEYLELARGRIAAWRLHLPDAMTEKADPNQLEIL